MTSAARRKAILFLILSALITVLLAVSLPQLKLQKGVPLPGEQSPTLAAPGEVEEPAPSVNTTTFFESVTGLFVLLVIIYFAFRRRQRLNKSELVGVLLRLAVLALTLSMFLFAFSKVEVRMIPAEAEILPKDVVSAVQGPPLAPLPETIVWLVWVLLAMLALLLAALLMRVRFQLWPSAGADPVKLEAEQAVEAIRAGQDLSNVIIRCYAQMSAILKKERGIALEETMTAREFEALLETRGVPSPPVRELTRLFELARYAAQAPGAAEEAQAIDCLNAIARYSQNQKPERAK